ncbi:D-glycero-beta-D-manno-heptose 1-phosphate adenylyltransferase [Streptomyces sp. B1I3]|uniref:D-glycero-beta-D-manno-heptose 1-phosphate adenylyltransferase n=1 Tax=Streptomyces sp. B1I3 TaxID=3042264 RepID=UPI0027862FB4|nr:D-glycero-beta-D-manno-heptose 1-phosphate adenylyltransferase [Streptomyces sp. B1I3]MDQ0792557.1 D-beta-D-heptose 7-phosphate kinase/D-beta-D-heptose 1-phosphate adenosyltransferase [Streptomyces sp. B1I3]
MNGPTPLLVVGDALLDHDLSGHADRLAPDAPVPVVNGARRTTRPGGAALAACLGAADGREVTLVTALGDDEASRTLRRLLQGRVRLIELPLTGELPCKTRIMARGVPLLRLDDGDGRAASATDQARAAVEGARAVLVADYGRGAADVLRDALTRAAARVPVVWDPHPRGGPPVKGVRLATPSAAEARGFATRDAARAPTRAGHDGACEPPPQGPQAELHRSAADARRLIAAWGVTSVAVTLGDRGALLSHGEEPLLVPAPWTADGDACGAGDRFAVTAAGLLADDALPETAVQGAVRAATQYVADGGARALAVGPVTTAPQDTAGDDVETDPCAPDAARLAVRVREEGGTVVAAGGCFDLLHAGHVALLQAARRTGDCLIVCVNSDASVRRRKGGTRPLVPVTDRVRVLLALECVDAVAVFEEDTPERLLGELRPHIWAKGGDYALTELPEARLVRSWGGQVVLLPYLDGRSTTALAERAARGPAPRPATRPRSARR